MYAIPLDSARQDAAPHGHLGPGASVAGGTGSRGGGGSGGGQGGGSRSSSTGTRGAANTARLVPGGQPGSLIHSANGFGSSSLVPELRGPLGSTVIGPQTSASSAPQLAMLLSLVLLAVGLFVGTRAWRGSGRPSWSQAS